MARTPEQALAGERRSRVAILITFVILFSGGELTLITIIKRYLDFILTRLFK
jgi:hypothetical protein